MELADEMRALAVALGDDVARCVQRDEAACIEPVFPHSLAVGVETRADGLLVRFRGIGEHGPMAADVPLRPYEAERARVLVRDALQGGILFHYWIRLGEVHPVVRPLHRTRGFRFSPMDEPLTKVRPPRFRGWVGRLEAFHPYRPPFSGVRSAPAVVGSELIRQRFSRPSVHEIAANDARDAEEGRHERELVLGVNALMERLAGELAGQARVEVLDNGLEQGPPPIEWRIVREGRPPVCVHWDLGTRHFVDVPDARWSEVWPGRRQTVAEFVREIEAELRAALSSS